MFLCNSNMTELNLAYGFSEQEPPQKVVIEKNYDNYNEEQSQQEKEYNTQMKQQLQQPPPPIQHQHQASGNTQNKKPVYYPNYSLWDRMMMKRPEVVKLAIFALVIVLGISFDRLGTHYLNKYLSDNILSDTQELLLRLSYPIMIFIILWIVKSM